jgi:tyrosyl-tRNA synthetase
MMSKDSVKKRLSGEDREGMSFTEFSYQLVQGYDYLFLNKHYGCKLQMGGSDQWGNITTGAELIRRTSGNEVFALTCPLMTKADGGKFGKTEKGNIWLSADYTTPYQFYQFWLNVSDEDAQKFVKIFTMLDRDTIDASIAEHLKDPGQRILQKLLAKEITTMVHGEEEWKNAVEASNILFGKTTREALQKLDERTFLAIFDGVEQFSVGKDKLKSNILDLLAVDTQVFPSKGECRKMIQGNGLNIDKEKYTDVNGTLNEKFLINGKYVLVQKGKKNYYILKFE